MNPTFVSKSTIPILRASPITSLPCATCWGSGLHHAFGTWLTSG
jgi:hypothetical protein